jgi:preprotein translocase subunit SecG
VLAQVPQWVLAGVIVLFVAISLLMILVVLIQKPQGGGLSGAFGASADGAGQTAFGAKTGDVLTFVTIAVFILFLVIAGALNLMIVPSAPEPGNTVSANGGGAGTTTPAGGATTPADSSIGIDLDTGDVTQTAPEDAGTDTETGTEGETEGETEEDYVPLSDQPAPEEPGDGEPGGGDGDGDGGGDEPETPGEGEGQPQ